MAEEWTYHRLCEAYREEKGTNRLNSLPADFGRSLQELISRLGSQAGGQKELDNARKQARLLVRLRRQKLMMRASMESEGAEPEGLTEGEKEIYGKIRSLYAQEDERLEGLMHPLPKMGEGESTAMLEKGGLNGGSVSAPAAKKKLKLLADIPEYRGADNEVYGPFATGQQVEVPPSEADSLLKARMAEEIA
ncbi:MAG: hypothetical protein M1530_03070 [Candidatus Marsarchaeota archaeon]|nr:hypothetical protein [Candidatus Marsarchaeota archaeon]